MASLNKVTEMRRQIAAELEAEVIGNSLPEPWKAQPKGKIERAMGQFVRGNISEAELRARLAAIKAELA